MSVLGGLDLAAEGIFDAEVDESAVSTTTVLVLATVELDHTVKEDCVVFRIPLTGAIELPDRLGGLGTFGVF